MWTRIRIELIAISAAALLASSGLAFESEQVAPGLRRWRIGNPSVMNGEALCCIAIDHLTGQLSTPLYVGTRFGRLYRRDGESWTTLLELEGTGVTSVAFEPPGEQPRRQHGKRMWLGTTDGIRLYELDSEKNDLTLGNWREKHVYTTHYQGHPSFVSGGYIPGPDATRRWGYVDQIYVPKQVRTYSPLVVSNAHGLFSYGGYHGVWHHFFPHYGGANTAWLDTRELLPLRRPTALEEDGAANLWIGSEGDGIVLMFAEGRKRNVGEDSSKMWRRWTPEQIGCPFQKVTAIHAGGEATWFGLEAQKKQRWIAQYNSKGNWQTWELPRIERPKTRNGELIELDWWQPTPTSLMEHSGRVLVGVTRGNARSGLLVFDPVRGDFEAQREFDAPVRRIAASDEGVWLMTDVDLYLWKGTTK